MVSIIILNYNDMILTEDYVNKISHYKCLDHIVVVDNCSPDGSYDYLKKLKSNKVSVIKTNSNNGYASGNNYGIQFVVDSFGKEGIVIISNPDIEIDENNMSKIVSSFSVYENLFAVTGQVMTVENKRIPLFTWKLPTVGMLFVENSTLLKILFRKLFKYNRRYCNEIEIEEADCYCGEVLPGCFFAADLTKLIEIGMFCEDTFLYFEEDLLFLKAKRKGYQSRVIKDATLTHAEGVTTKKNISTWRQREKIMEDSAMIYLKSGLDANKFLLFSYRVCNRLFLPERYLYYLIKSRMQVKTRRKYL